MSSPSGVVGLFRILWGNVSFQTPWLEFIACCGTGGFGSKEAGAQRLGIEESQRHVPWP